LFMLQEYKVLADQRQGPPATRDANDGVTLWNNGSSDPVFEHAPGNHLVTLRCFRSRPRSTVHPFFTEFLSPAQKDHPWR
jgi:hypothetical protein